MSKWYNVGKIVNTQGLKGQVRVLSSTDFKEERYKPGNKLTIFMEKNEQVEVEIASHRSHKNLDILAFVGMDHINDVEKYKGSLLKVHESQLSDLGENEFYHHEILGLKVVTEDGMELGSVKEILTPGANDVWVVKKAGKKDLLLPYIESVVRKVDLENQKVTVHLLEGLLDE